MTSDEKFQTGGSKWQYRADGSAPMRLLLRSVKFVCSGVFQYVLLLIFAFAAIVGRYKKKPIQIGLGPEGLINDVYLKQALECYGYTVETYTFRPSFITQEFDYYWGKYPLQFRYIGALVRKWYLIRLVLHVLWQYECLYLYFAGGVIRYFPLISTFEPWLYHLARVKVVMLCYGGDVHDLLRTPNLAFRAAMIHDYPSFYLLRKKIIRNIDLWIYHATYIVISGDLVDYAYHWNQIIMNWLSIDVQKWRPSQAEISRLPGQPLKVLHAPNHKKIKGTAFFLAAVQELQKEGIPIELIIVEKIPNDKLLEYMQSADVIADQLLIGWYGMFAVEAMALGKPVLCYIRDDLRNLYITDGQLALDEPPIISCTPLTVKDVLRDLALHPEKLMDWGTRTRAYVLKHHSARAVGAKFDALNQRIGLLPDQKAN